MDIQKILDSADKAKKPKHKRRKNRGGFVATTIQIMPNGNMTMEQMVNWKCAQHDFFEDAAECGDRGEP